MKTFQRYYMKKTEVATLANGCFWCTETIFKQLKGVVSVTPGYTGGTTTDVEYEGIHSRETGHAEAIQIIFNPEKISYEDLLDVFWHTHNPTTLNRQGADVGEEYRSAIFHHSDKQKKIAEESLKDFEKEGLYDDPVVTEITPASKFIPAEEYHHDFYKKHPDSLYCKFVIDPKLEEFWKRYKYLT